MREENDIYLTCSIEKEGHSGNAPRKKKEKKKQLIQILKTPIYHILSHSFTFIYIIDMSVFWFTPYPLQNTVSKHRLSFFN